MRLQYNNNEQYASSSSSNSNAQRPLYLSFVSVQSENKIHAQRMRDASTIFTPNKIVNMCVCMMCMYTYIRMTSPSSGQAFCVIFWMSRICFIQFKSSGFISVVCYCRKPTSAGEWDSVVDLCAQELNRKSSFNFN